MSAARDAIKKLRVWDKSPEAEREKRDIKSPCYWPDCPTKAEYGCEIKDTLTGKTRWVFYCKPHWEPGMTSIIEVADERVRKLNAEQTN